MTVAKERFAGANSLALSIENFERDYPVLAADVSDYVAFIRNCRKKSKYLLGARLFMKFVEDDPGFGGLRAFLAAPNTDKRNAFNNAMKNALEASYARLIASELYSSKTALEYAKKAAGIFRWLASDRPHYPSVPRQLVFKKRAPKGPRKRKNVSAPFQPMELEEISSTVSPILSDDLVAYRESFAERGHVRILGFRYFLSYLKQDPSDHGDMLLASMSGSPDARCDAAMIRAILEECEIFLLNSKAFSPSTIASWMRDCGIFFEHLAGLAERSYTHYSRRYKKSKFVPSESTTLADLNLPETEELAGAAKLRRSLELVRDAAMDVVRRHVAFFDAMAPARESRALVNARAETCAALAAIATVVQAEVHSLALTKQSQFSKRGARSNNEAVDAAMSVLAKAETWRQAGARDLVPNSEDLSFQQIMSLVRCAIGANHATIVAAKIVFCCETGWNRQPISDIPPHVFAFRLLDKCGVASANFLSVFKTRAGHDVLALLERSTSLDGIRQANVIAGWENAERFRSWRDFDERCLLNYTSPAYEALELLRPLVARLDDFSSDPEVHCRFFKYLGWNVGVSVNERDIYKSFEEGVLATSGLTFPLIRKAFLQFTLREVGSVESLRAEAGHAGTGVLLRYYLNSPDTLRELKQSTRFFQNAVQALVAAEVGGSLEVLMSKRDHEWFLNLARASGVASAVGYDVSMPTSEIHTLKFDPSDAQIRALLALHMSLKAESKTVSPRRWSLIGVPLLGFVMAMENKLKEAGLSKLVRRIAKQLVRDLRDGGATLQPLNLTSHIK